MALWGKTDSKSVTGTVSVTQYNGSNESAARTVTGIGSSFTSQLKPGQALFIGGVEYKVGNIESNTVLKLTKPYLASTQSGLTVTASEAPAYTSGLYGVTAAESDAGADSLMAIRLVEAGTGYVEAPSVTITEQDGDAAPSTDAVATATVSGGKVSGFSISNIGAGYVNPPTIEIDEPRLTIPSADVDTTEDTITYEDHGLTTGDILEYVEVGTAIDGLVTETEYYAVVVDADTFSLAETLEDATAETPVVIDLDGDGNDDQYFVKMSETVATAAPVMGAGKGNTVTPGWVKRTVGTGGRAGRITYETLVASKSITGDASDDTVFPDA